MNYRDLEIWKLAREAAIDLHGMTLQELPKFEMSDEGSQIRRSVKSIRSNIVEGYDSVEREHRTDISDPASRIPHPAS